MKRTAVLLVLPALLFLLPGGVSAAAFNDIVAFGDSLTDNGNIYAISGGLLPDPDTYYEGRFSNGPVWVEYMAAQLKLNGTLDDNAYGGAKSGWDSDVFSVGLKSQVAAFLA